MASAGASAAAKPVSSRLLNMKFMQRPSNAKGSSRKSIPASNSNSNSDTTTTPTQIPTVTGGKTDKRRVDISRAAIREAVASEDGRRAAAIGVSAAGMSERWSLGVPAVRGGGEMVGAVRVFIGDLPSDSSSSSSSDDDDDDDNSDDGEDEGGKEGGGKGTGRRYFGGRTAPAPTVKRDPTSDDDQDTSDDDSTDERDRRAKKAASKIKAADRTLRTLTQIGGRAPSSSSPMKDVECYTCHQRGHVRAACPVANNGNNGNSNGRGRGRKRGVEGDGGAGSGNFKKRQRRS
ncbi:hypothetical protein Dda_4148 [Drechslerella dactyloides]|uniref:CCHC-type domain-containing protein n=1 Tax=Drechslerella dactyloides TaxID=74499 RepID=A0AAD6IZ78_DREDA|nr:hypothetical protein Dda_4148 [Drechslerella dactyloides]